MAVLWIKHGLGVSGGLSKTAREGITLNIFKVICKYIFLFCVGGFIYGAMEILYRGYTHWSMIILSGICFIYAGIQNEFTKWEQPLSIQMLKVSVFITLGEFFTGCIVNLWLGWNVWDYSTMWGNLLGQVCPLFSFLWFFLSAVGIILDDYLRYWLFGEEKPSYRIF